MKLSEIIQFLEHKAPLSLQESYDNSGLIVGDPTQDVTGAVICLDSTEEVIEEAIRLGANLVIAHHPIVFSGLKKITGRSYIEKAILRAIRSDVAIYAIHTNLDNVLDGVNSRIARQLGLQDVRILDPRKSDLLKLVVFVPQSHIEEVRNALFRSGAGHIGNYDECGYQVNGEGTFRALSGADPFVGQQGVRHTEQEARIEVILPAWLENQVVREMKRVHPYEEVAYDLYALSNRSEQWGSGIIGKLTEPVPASAFLFDLKIQMKAGIIRHTAPVQSTVETIAVCGGSGSFLLPKAISAGADVFVTADLKYHQFFDADHRILLADIGHYESEQYTIDLISDWLREKFPIFATHKTGVVTNPINYL